LEGTAGYFGRRKELGGKREGRGGESVLRVDCCKRADLLAARRKREEGKGFSLLRKKEKRGERGDVRAPRKQRS